MTEQDILNQFLNPRFNPRTEGIIVGPGDDCAVLKPPPGQVLAVTTDTLVEGIHFFKGTDPYDIAYKAVAVNLSDLASMGAMPAWMLGNFTLPSADPLWLKDFSKGLYDCLHEFNTALVGGDLTRGPLVITFTAMGFLPEGQSVKRSGASAQDYVAVTGRIGEAASAFRLIEQGVLPAHIPPECLARFHRPKPRVAVGQALRGIASSMIDVTDGLTKDAERLARASGLGMELWAEKIPLPHSFDWKEDQSVTQLQDLISFGDDYELCFTIPESYVQQIGDQLYSPVLTQIAKEYQVPIHVMGRMQQASQFTLIVEGESVSFESMGFDHFQKSY